MRDHERNYVVLGLVGLADPVADALARRVVVEEAHDRLFVAGGFVGLNLGHHDYHDNWNDLAKAVRALWSALEAFRAEYAPPAVPDDGDKPWGAMGDDENHLVDAAEKFGTFLDAVIASGE